MDWSNIIKELGGGLSAVALVGLAFWVWTKEKRNNELTDKFIDMNSDNIQAMNRLTNAIREGRQVDE